MERSRLGLLSILIFHQHLLHTRQPLPPSSSCISSGSGLADCRAFLSDAPASHHCQRNCEAAGSLRSLGVTPVHRYCRPFRHLLAFLPFPGSAGYRSDLLQSISLWGEEGFSSCLTCPCHRAAPNHPAGVAGRLGQPTACPCCLRPTPGSSASGVLLFSRPPLSSRMLRPGDSLTIPKMALSVGFIRFVSSTDATRATAVLTFPPVGLSPTEHVCLFWTHWGAQIRSAHAARLYSCNKPPNRSRR